MGLDFVVALCYWLVYSRTSQGHVLKMAFTLGSLFEACLLIINAIAVLSQERFLAKSKNQNSKRRSVVPLLGIWSLFLKNN